MTDVIERVIHLEDNRIRRREVGELATEGLTAYTLFDAVRASYANHQLDAFVALNAVAAAALAIVVVRGVSRIRRHEDAASRGANLVGVFGGLAAVIEGFQKLHSAAFTPGHKHFALGVATVIAGLATAAIAMAAERLESRRAITITDAGIRMRLNRYRRFNVRWSDLTELRSDSKAARLVTASGKSYVIPLGRLVNRAEVWDALLESSSVHGVPVKGG